jgi:hypothetical protein
VPPTQTAHQTTNSSSDRPSLGLFRCRGTLVVVLATGWRPHKPLRFELRAGRGNYSPRDNSSSVAAFFDCRKSTYRSEASTMATVG